MDKLPLCIFLLFLIARLGAFAQSGSGPAPLEMVRKEGRLSVGQCRVLYMPVTFANRHDFPITQEAARAMLAEVADFYSRSSYGQLTLQAVVTPGLRLPHSAAWYEQRDINLGTNGNMDSRQVMHEHARNEARLLGYDPDSFDIVILRQDSGLTNNASTNEGRLWLGNNSAQTTAHEIGHTLGLNHANAWNTSGTSTAGPGTDEEYAHPFDIMGLYDVPFPQGHFNAAAKTQLGWMPAVSAPAITRSGVYRIHALDRGRLEAGQRQALKIVKDAQRTYWGEVRSLFGSNPWVSQGLVLAWNFPAGGTGNAHILDTTPGSAFGLKDAPLALGHTFSDRDAGIHITTLAVGEASAYADVCVNLGRFPGNRAPVATLSPAEVSVPVGGSAEFSVNATDADGDVLAYGWKHLGHPSTQLVSPNAPVISRTFPYPGRFVVACTVSDMKGGTATRFAVVNVGDGNGRSLIRGRITQNGQGLEGVVVTANGGNGTVTDSDGRYVIPNLAPGQYVVMPLLHGFRFAEQFANNVAVGPDFESADFVAESLPTVSLVAEGGTVVENGGTGGKFVLSRSGPARGALPVLLQAPKGSALLTTDYALNPAPKAAGAFQMISIPDGQASVEIQVLPVTDALQEGPESVELELAADYGYVLGDIKASLFVAEAGNSIQRVAVSAAQSFVREGDTGGFVLRRTGDITLVLEVSLQVAGNAVSGTDYSALPAVVSFAAGQSEVTLPLVSLQNTAADALRNVSVAVAGGGDVMPEPGAGSASISIVDDDLSVLAISAPDGSATEGGDSGQILVSREGDLSRDLQVYYTVTGSAFHGEDFHPLPGMVMLKAGMKTAAITVSPVADGWGEGDEFVDLRLASAPEQYRLAGDETARVVIHDAVSDKPTVGVLATLPAGEGTSNGRFTFSIKGATPGLLTVKYTVSGTATAGSDYLITGLNTTSLQGTATVVIPADGAVEHNMTLLVVNDSLAESSESVRISLTPDPAYRIATQTSESVLWIGDNERPAVYVDVQSGTAKAVSDAVLESNASAVVVFYFSRTGSLTNALTVTYTVAGSATAGSDYAALSGTVTIPAGSAGVAEAVTLLDDSLVEGTETVEVTVVENSTHSAGPAAILKIADNETAMPSVAFNEANSSVNEGAGTVSIPVSLSGAATVPTRVEYEVGSIPTTSQKTVTAMDLPLWVRVVRTDNGFFFYHSSDGVEWGSPLRSSAITSAMSNSTYLVGLCVGSGSSGTACTAVFDNVSVTDRENGSTISGLTSADVGSVSPDGSTSVSNGTYTVTGGGAGLGRFTTTNPDRFRFAYFTVRFSRTCTLTARVVSMTGGNADAKVGVMIRETTQDLSLQCSQTAVPGGGSSYNYRVSTSNPISNGLIKREIVRPFWLGIQRQGEWVSSLRSHDGTAWITTEKWHLPALASQVSAGLAVSSKNTGSLTSAVFEQVGFQSGGPAVGFQHSTISSSNPGSYSLSGGRHSLSGGGKGIDKATDSFDFASQQVEGDFFLKAKLVSQSSGTSSTQAGVMLRETLNADARMMFMSGIGSGTNAAGYGSWSRAGSGRGATGSGTDFTLVPGVLEFAVGEQTKSVPVQIHDDSLLEGPERFALSLVNPRQAVLGENARHTLIIEDNDSLPAQPLAGFASAASAASEAAGNALVKVSLSHASALPVTVNYSSAGGTAIADVDYTLELGTLTFAPGETVKEIVVMLLNDTIREADKTVVLQLSGLTGASAGNQQNHTLTIADDDLPVVTLTASDAVAAESGDAGKFVITRSGLTTSSLTVLVAASGTATAGSDYSSLPASVVFAPGQAEAELAVSPLQDDQVEGPENVVLQILPDTAYGTAAVRTAEVWISDDEYGTVSFLPASPQPAKEGSRPAVWTLQRTGALNLRIPVQVFFTGRAVRGTDYEVEPGTFEFQPGQDTLTLTLNPADDGVVEDLEDAVAVLLPGAYDIGPVSSSRLEIEDNDVAPRIRILSPVRTGQIISAGNGLAINATVTDDGLPQPLTTSWTQVSGPAPAIFDDASQSSTGVSFNAAGIYVLRLIAYDGQFTTTADLTVKSQDSDTADWELLSIGTVTTPAPTVTNASGTITLGGAGRLDIAVVDPVYDSPSTGAFYARSFVGDFVMTVRHGTASSSASRARSGLMVRASTDPYSAYAHVGRVPQSAYDGFLWRTTQGGIKDGVASYSGTERWLRLVRRGNVVTAFHAPDVAGTPGDWVQLGPPQVVVLPDVVKAGLFVDNNLGSGLNTVVFSGFSMASLNRAPVVDIVPPAFDTLSPVALQGSVTDDGLPEPASLTHLWRRRAGPGPLVFNDEDSLATAALFSQFGAYTARLQADDGAVTTFKDLSFTGHRHEFEAWLSRHFPGGPASVDGDYTADPDQDGLNNLEEYAFGFDPRIPSLLEKHGGLVTIDGKQYLQLTLHKNGDAVGIGYGGELTGDLGDPQSWADGEVVVEINTPDLLRIRDSVPVTERTRRFLRARLRLTD